jgi:hypothetical protein
MTGVAVASDAPGGAVLVDEVLDGWSALSWWISILAGDLLLAALVRQLSLRMRPRRRCLRGNQETLAD